MRLERVIAADLCSGCGLCASVLGPERARMVVSPDGFLRPNIVGSIGPAEDALLEKVCPGGRLDHHDNGEPFATALGPAKDVYLGFAADPALRYKASSGGLLSALAQYTLESGRADYVIHVGADPKFPWLNEVRESRTAADVVGNTGSRYAPSAPLADILQQLGRPGRAVVIGKPCDVAGLRMLSRENPLINEKVAAILTFICGGVPSNHGVELLLARMGVHPDEVASFRYRGYGWPGRTTAILKTGEERSLSYAESWGDILSHHVQKRCKVCPDGVGVFGDVVCGDGWYGDERGYPKFDEQDGRSIAIARTAAGSDLLRAAATAGRIALQPSSLTEIAKMQPAQLRRTRLTPSRLIAMAILGRTVPKYRGLHLMRAARDAGIMANIKSFLGALRRVVTGKL